MRETAPQKNAQKEERPPLYFYCSVFTGFLNLIVAHPIYFTSIEENLSYTIFISSHSKEGCTAAREERNPT